MSIILCFVSMLISSLFENTFDIVDNDTPHIFARVLKFIISSFNKIISHMRIARNCNIKIYENFSRMRLLTFMGFAYKIYSMEGKAVRMEFILPACRFIRGV